MSARPIHLAMPRQGEMNAPGVPPPIACGTREPEQWCGQRERVTCQACLFVDKRGMLVTTITVDGDEP